MKHKNLENKNCLPDKLIDCKFCNGLAEYLVVAVIVVVSVFVKPFVPTVAADDGSDEGSAAANGASFDLRFLSLTIW